MRQKRELCINKSTYGFALLLAKSTNLHIITIEKTWIVRIDIWNVKLCALLQEHDFRLQMLCFITGLIIIHVYCDMFQLFFCSYLYF